MYERSFLPWLEPVPGADEGAEGAAADAGELEMRLPSEGSYLAEQAGVINGREWY